MTAPTTSNSRGPLLLGIALAVVVALAAGVWYFFIRDDSPAAFDIDTAADGAGDADDASSETTTDDDSDPSDGETADDGVEGTWTVDPEAGAAAGGTSAGFRVDEELASIGATTAVGRTDQVTGTLTIEGTTVTEVEIVVDMGSLATDDSRRDGRMRDALATDEFPTSSFVLTEPIELGSVPAEGETVSVTAIGEMTIKGVTNPVEVELEAQVVDGTLVVVGSLPVVFADYGVEAPSSVVVVSVEDNGIIEFQLYLARS